MEATPAKLVPFCQHVNALVMIALAVYFLLIPCGMIIYFWIHTVANGSVSTTRSEGEMQRGQ
jgi:hypothetical protein